LFKDFDLAAGSNANTNLFHKVYLNSALDRYPYISIRITERGYTRGNWNRNYARWNKKRPASQILLFVFVNDSNKNSGVTTFFPYATMKTTGLRNFFLLVFVQRIAQDFLAFFRFTEADACSILSAYGLHNLEVDRLQNNRPNEQEERVEAWGG
jgi:hypothetical protein